MEGVFITFEGIEGCGKSTQVKIIASTLQERGLPVVVTREPGGCPIADQIRSILLDAKNTALVATAELMLYAAARAQHVQDVILPALKAGKVVLCDRFSDSTFAYQGYGRHVDRSSIVWLNRMAQDGRNPDLTIILDLPVEEGLKRARCRNGADTTESRFETEVLDFHRNVKHGFDTLARMDYTRCRKVDASGSKEEVARTVEGVVSALLCQKFAAELGAA